MSDEPQNTERQQEPGTAPESSGQEQTFTQADIDRIIAERLRRSTETTTQKLLEKLGVDSLDTAAKTLAEYRQRKEAEMSEAEKAAAAAEQARKEAAEYKAALEAERQQRVTDKRDNALAQALATSQAIDADDVVLWLQKHKADEVAALIDEGGAINPDGIMKLVAAAKSERPHFFRPGGPGSPSNRGGEVPQVPMSEKARIAAELAARHGFKVDERGLAARYQQHEDKS